VIKDSPFPLFQTTSTGYVYRTTLRKHFDAAIEDMISFVHYVATCSNATMPKTAANIGRLACRLSTELESSGLSGWFLASDVAAINHLAKQVQVFERSSRIAPRARAAAVRKYFVSQLLEAANDVGGRLGINQRNGRGSLVEVIDLLRPYLPAEFQRGLSARTLRRIKPRVGQKLKKSIQKS
jgi:hypothetical protein